STLSGAIDSVVESVGGTIAGAVDTVTETVGDFAGSVGQAAGAAWASVQETAKEVAGVAAELTDDVKRLLGDGYTALTGILQQLADGLGLGPSFLGALDALIGKLKKLVTGEGEQEEGKEVTGSIGTVTGGAIAGNGGCDHASAPSRPGARRLPLRASLGLGPSSARQRVEPAGAGHAHDRVDSKLSLTSTSARKLLPVPDSAFGYAMPDFSLSKGLWRTNSSWWYDHVDLTANVELENSWDIQDRGRETIAGPEDEKITAGNWRAVVADLTPGADGVPKRHNFWAPGPTRAHEEFHCKDYTERAEKFLATATEWLTTKDVDVPFWDTEPAVRRQLTPLLEALAKKFSLDAKAHLDNGGEARAYGATRGLYSALTDGISARAGREHWG
ncbi:MAG: hypothetical protein ABIS47_08805, partial [Acidimicrobiales bacterium]